MNQPEPPPQDLPTESSPDPVERLRARSHAAQQNIVGEFFDFLRSNKKWWLTPIVVILIILSVFVLLTNSAIAPFIYVFF